MKEKHTITIFVSGAKRLKEHRMRLKVLANDLNGECRKRGYNIIVNIYSYMNLGDDQKEYDEFIKHKSDIVFFLIEDTMGEKTRGEFLLASEAYKTEGVPKIYVFLKEFQETTPEITEIENLINSNSNSYYVEYSNIEDLVSKVKIRLQEEIAERMDKMNVSPPKKMRKMKYWAVTSTLAFLMLLGYGLLKAYTTDNKVILLFAGGGSAVNCLKSKYEAIGDVYTYKNSIAIGLPTKAAWALVSAEVLHHHALKGSRVQTPFYPVCLSAKKAQESDSLQLCDEDQFVEMII